MALDPAWIALIGTIFGGVGLRVVAQWLDKSKIRIDEAGKIRDELRIEINAQREEIKQLEIMVEKWRKDYYDLRDEFTNLKTQYMIQLDSLKRQLETARNNIGPINK